jgi:hypothetical protein
MNKRNSSAETTDEQRTAAESGTSASLEQNGLLGDVWFMSDRPFAAYPIGTKAKAIGGGYWIKNERGWKWCTGSTFPCPGGDWTGEVSLPNIA